MVRNTELVFEPDPSGRPRPARLLSDGQRSLLHLALTAAALDVEAVVYDRQHHADFMLDAAQLPNLTLIAVEEPENSLSPFFLSRIVNQLRVGFHKSGHRRLTCGFGRRWALVSGRIAGS